MESIRQPRGFVVAEDLVGEPKESSIEFVSRVSHSTLTIHLKPAIPGLPSAVRSRRKLTPITVIKIMALVAIVFTVRIHFFRDVGIIL